MQKKKKYIARYSGRREIAPGPPLDTAFADVVALCAVRIAHFMSDFVASEEDREMHVTFAHVRGAAAPIRSADVLIERTDIVLPI